MYKIDIKDALYFTVIAVVVLEIFSKMTCFIDSKRPTLLICITNIHLYQYFSIHGSLHNGFDASIVFFENNCPYIT